MRCVHVTGVKKDRKQKIEAPGFSLHDELEQLVRHVGFMSMQALAVATNGVPRFYVKTGAFGGVEPGRMADLVLLDAIPVADIPNTKRIRGVSVGGRWLERTELDALLRDVENNAKAGCRALNTNRRHVCCAVPRRSPTGTNREEGWCSDRAPGFGTSVNSTHST